MGSKWALQLPNCFVILLHTFCWSSYSFQIWDILSSFGFIEILIFQNGGIYFKIHKRHTNDHYTEWKICSNTTVWHNTNIENQQYYNNLQFSYFPMVLYISSVPIYIFDIAWFFELRQRGSCDVSFWRSKWAHLKKKKF